MEQAIKYNAIRTNTFWKTWTYGKRYNMKHENDLSYLSDNMLESSLNTKGHKYVGDFTNNFQNGKGTYTWGEGNNKGDKYVGEWKDGQPNGKGTYTWGEGNNKGDKYVGEFINNQKTGQGTCTYANGDKYVGEWKDGKSHGKGTFTISDGRIIEGLFEDGQHKSILIGE